MKKVMLLALTLVTVAPVAVEAQQDRQGIGFTYQDLAELEEIGGVNFERGILGRGDRFTGNVASFQWHNGCWDNVTTAVRITADCIGRDRETPDAQERDVKINASLIDGVFHGTYVEVNFLNGGAAHSMMGDYNMGSKCGPWSSFWISTVASIEAVIAYTNQPMYQETFPPC